ncbi:S8 family serine peptidase [Carboxylicivirga marina]|uniref:S8 family serine peptidase n=1 Tax=Carboxylicivirga marina TaxID=2800988 RepID=UPI00259670C8|nr:S8 family serine peptidase [uncultured Carboxylicivirga sp.]
MKHILAILLISVIAQGVFAQNGYFVSFSDKSNSPYSIERPKEFLSTRSIERRERQNIQITEEDLPVNPAYLDSLKKAGIDVRHATKWLNGAIVFSTNKSLMDTLARVTFVDAVEITKPSSSSRSEQKFEQLYPGLKSELKSLYGDAWSQIQTVNGQKLHQLGYKGNDIHIAVIDAGFYKTDELPLFEHLWNNNQIIGTKDFVNPVSNIFNEHSHGMSVLSIMGGKADKEYLGTAPEASYWLLRTEDASSEHPIEPDYWICAAEFADSAGVDIINTSLGYYEFDAPSTSYSYDDDMDGSTRISRASDIAASKGMLIITSAGNEGNDTWRYIGAPADAQNCIAVGAMLPDSTKAVFSSFGPTSNGRTKPEITCQGVSVAVQGSSGSIYKGNGTSFSAPVISGLAACLWQALPLKTATEIRQLIIDSGHQSSNPNNELGYGIPNFELAYHVDIPENEVAEKKWKVGPNPFRNELRLTAKSNMDVTVSIVDLTGRLKYQQQHVNGKQIVINKVAQFPEGIYIVTIKSKHFHQHVKVIKSY